MAIEVIKEPPQSSLPIEVGCKHCLAQLKVTALSDIQFLKGDQREPDPSLWITCPRCKNKVTLPVKGFTQFDLILIEQQNHAKSVDAYYNDNLR